LEGYPPFGTEIFEEGGVGFESCGVGRCFFNDSQAKIKGGFGSGMLEISKMWIKPDTE